MDGSWPHWRRGSDSRGCTLLDGIRHRYDLQGICKWECGQVMRECAAKDYELWVGRRRLKMDRETARLLQSHEAKSGKVGSDAAGYSGGPTPHATKLFLGMSGRPCGDLKSEACLRDYDLLSQIPRTRPRQSDRRFTPLLAQYGTGQSFPVYDRHPRDPLLWSSRNPTHYYSSSAFRCCPMDHSSACWTLHIPQRKVCEPVIRPWSHGVKREYVAVQNVVRVRKCRHCHFPKRTSSH